LVTIPPLLDKDTTLANFENRNWCNEERNIFFDVPVSKHFWDALIQIALKSGPIIILN